VKKYTAVRQRPELSSKKTVTRFYKNGFVPTKTVSSQKLDKWQVVCYNKNN
jgi:hypothetical protein